MFVIEHGHASSICAEHLDDFLKELVARVELLSEFVGFIFAVLADQQHGVDRQFVAATAQGFGDGG